MKVEVFTLNAFAKTENGGNPAGVVLGADSYSEDQMLAVAKMVGFSETAFVSKSDEADFKVRFFTPKSEVDLCGHATIATFYLLKDLGTVRLGKYTQETRAGVLPIIIRENGMIFMEQKLPEYGEVIDSELICESLNIDKSVLSDILPAQVVSTGLRDVFVPVRDLDSLLNIKPDFLKIAEVSRQFDLIGYHLFTLETKFDSTAHCRNFAPLCDIDEEAATGTSSGALSCYLFNYGKLRNQDLNKLVFEQGYFMNRPSEIFTSLTVDGDSIKKVCVGGIAANIQKIYIEI